MFQSKKLMSILALLLVVGTAFVLSGCATCCGETPSKPVGSSKCAMGTHGGDKSNSAIWVEKSMPSQVISGKSFQYTITATNLRDCALDDVIISERFSEQFEGQSSLPEGKMTSEGAEWAVGYMKPREAKTITVTGVAKSSGAATTCTKVTYNPVLCCKTEVISPNLKVVLEAPAEASLCDVIPVKVTVTNTGTGYAKGAAITQMLPEGLLTTDGKQSVSINVGDLAGGASKAYAVNLKAQRVGSFSNTASASASGGLSAASSSVTTEVVQPSLKVTVDGPSKIFVTKDADYRVSVQNAGNADSASTVVTTTVPSGMKFVRASNGGREDDGRVTWNVGTLPAGQGVSLDATFKAVTGGSGQSVARATGTCCQEASAQAASDVQGIPAILLEVVDTEDPIQVGGTEKLYVTVTNQGSAPDNDIVVKVDFEENLDYVASAGPTQGKSEDVKSVEFAPLASLGAGQKATWEVTAKAVKEGDHRTTIVMTSDAISRPVQETEATRIY
jgi:uncharacterized repeat protein (TIGR01451 family)